MTQATSVPGNPEENKPHRISLEKVITEIVKIPPSPQILPKLQSLLRDPESDPSDIVKLLMVDVSLTAQVLKFANSSYVGLAAPVQGLEEAVYLMGFREIFKIVSVAVAMDVMNEALHYYNAEEGELLENSVATAQIMSAIADEQGLRGQESYYTSGLLHDIGKIVVNQYLHKRGLSLYGGSTPEGEITPPLTIEHEQHFFGFDHAQAGAALLKSWNFSDEIIIPIRNQYQPEKSESYRTITSSLVVSMQLAHELVKAQEMADGSLPRWHNLEPMAEKIEMEAAKLDEVLQIAFKNYTEIRKMLRK